MLLAVLLLPLSADEITWLEDYDQAQAKAQETGQSLFVLLTAPDWCSYCQWLDENTLQDPRVIEMVNTRFVAVKITDKNPQIERFDFEGYPTTQIFSSQGEKQAEGVGAIEADSYINRFTSYGKEATGNDQQFQSAGDNPIKLYGRDSSQRTQTLMDYFSSQGIDYEFHDVSIPEERSEIKSAIEAFGYTGTIYLPIIIIDDLIYFPPS